jgi:hypothetical protein
MLYSGMKYYQRFEVDLYALYKLDYCSFFVSPASVQPKIPKMRIQILQDKKVLFDQLYAEWFTYQLEDKRFNSQNLNELRVPLKGVQSRYLTV